MEISKEIICKICGDTFTNNVSFFYHLKNKHTISSKEYYIKFVLDGKRPTCLNCGKETIYRTPTIGFDKYCSTSCKDNYYKITEKGKETFIKARKTKIEKYGEYYEKEIYKKGEEKKKQTTLEKYGVEYALQNENVKQKSKDTQLKRYGEVMNFSSKNHQTAVKNIIQEKYGVDYPLQNKEIMDKKNMTNVQKYGAPHVLQNKKIKNKMKNTLIKNKRCVSDDKLSDFLLYKRIVNRITKINKTKFNIQEKSNFHIDHKFSIFEGFMQNIPPYIIGSEINLEPLPAKQNISKGIKCSITKKELIENFLKSR